MSIVADPDEVRAAVELLGVEAGADHQRIRSAYRRAVKRIHPDHSSDPDAAARTMRLRAAYELLVSQPAPPVRAEARPEEEVLEVDVVEVEVVDEDTVALGVPPGEALALLIGAAHRLGDVGYLDPLAGLLEVIVEFVDAPTCSVVFSLQGRATGATEVFCTVEPLSGGGTPPVEAVTRLLARTLRGEDPTH